MWFVFLRSESSFDDSDTASETLSVHQSAERLVDQKAIVTPGRDPAKIRRK